jgi:type VI secretion system secreted protein VgrG
VLATASDGDGSRELFAFDASIHELGEAGARAAVALERLETERAMVSGTTTSAELRAGHRITVDDVGGGFTGTYIVTSVRHSFVRSDDGCLAYGNAFEAVPEGTPYRPPLRTPTPRVHGVHTAVVTGPGWQPVTSTSTAVKVQFHWDRHGAMDENSSAWIRVAACQQARRPQLYLPEVGDEICRLRAGDGAALRDRHALQ